MGSSQRLVEFKVDGLFERSVRSASIYEEGLNGFGGFNGLLGPGIEAQSRHSASEMFFVVKNRKNELRLGLAIPALAAVPSNPLNPPNPFKPSVIDAVGPQRCISQ